ncbi:restriction modification system DNA specificity domain [Alkaliphilus metalliredigens QYMF]|uniref:Restriction modification system DNA specificity domain n=1 Tax=Alkaliphilus metalliredigens (strain QYMF) TaxID=293826 RepID=A6TNL7_ALKMQ|nr:restriction endonuclease subunit S [Alkaliphilus metalliredigens]ABR47785.1 restriction modification system DNA specificity domain [Alkaliphilus metalliredigens QYMF]
MAETKKLIPKRRFKEFQNAEAWEPCKLSDLTEYKNGKGHEDKQSTSGKYELVNLNSISIDGGLKHSGKFVDDTTDTLFKNDLVMVLSDVGHGDLLGRVALIPENDRFVLNQRVALLRPNRAADPQFLFSYINAHQRYFKAQGAGMSQLNISKGSVESFTSFIPDKEEQVKIGKHFKQLDNLITLHQRKLDKIKSMKKAYLYEMFPVEGESRPKRRFKGFTDAWEQRKLTDEVELFSGLTYSPNDIVKDNGTFVLRSSNVKNGEVVDADNVYVNSEVVNSCNVKNGDIIVVVRNGSRSLIGKHAQIKGDKDKTVIGAFMTGLRSNHSDFVNALLDTPLFKSEIDKNLGATINQITNGMFHQMKFMIPNPEEQDRIGKLFTGLDNLITLHQHKLEKLKNLKKAYLNEMFI